MKHKNNVLFAVEAQEAARGHYGDTQDISNKVLPIFDTERLVRQYQPTYNKGVEKRMMTYE